MKKTIRSQRIPAVTALLATLFLSTAAIAAPTSGSGESAFDAMKNLSGAWAGKDDDNQPVTANYEVSSGGTIVLEKLQTGTYPCMTSVYHRDGDSMMMTHFCNMNNQPRLRLKNYDQERKVIDFDFVDITNLKSAKDGHIKKLSLSFPDDTHMVQDWSFEQGEGKPDSHAIFNLERVKDTFDPASMKEKQPAKGSSSPQKKG